MRIDSRVTGYGAGQQAQAARAPSPPASFRLPETKTSPRDTSADAATRSRAAAPLATMDAILALQGEENPSERRRRFARKGTEVLDALDRLKAAILGGRVPEKDLRVIAERLAALSGSSGDPGLDDVIAHIELRARVELAKLGRA